MTDRRKSHSTEEPGEGVERPKVRVTDKRRFLTDDESSGDRPDESSSSRAIVDENNELAKAKADAAEYLEHLQRLKAEFDNYRKRILKEQTHAVEVASEALVQKLLEVLDEFELALIAAGEAPDFDKFRRGVELVYAKLIAILKSEGLDRMEAEGKHFDPEHHEALLQTGGGSGEPYVDEVLRPGYTLRGRVIRPAGVRVRRK